MTVGGFSVNVFCLFIDWKTVSVLDFPGIGVGRKCIKRQQENKNCTSSYSTGSKKWRRVEQAARTSDNCQWRSTSKHPLYLASQKIWCNWQDQQGRFSRVEFWKYLSFTTQMVFSNTTYMNRSYHLPVQLFILQCVEIRLKEWRDSSIYSQIEIFQFCTEIQLQVQILPSFVLEPTRIRVSRLKQPTILYNEFGRQGLTNQRGKSRVQVSTENIQLTIHQMLKLQNRQFPLLCKPLLF